MAFEKKDKDKQYCFIESLVVGKFLCDKDAIHTVPVKDVPHVLLVSVCLCL